MFVSNAATPDDVSLFFRNNYPLLSANDTTAILAQYPQQPPLPNRNPWFPTASQAYGEATFICPSNNVLAHLHRHSLSHTNTTTTNTSSYTPALTNGDSTHTTTTTTIPNDDPPPPLPVAAHLGPLFGALCALAGLGLEQTAYVFMLGHVKALVSAAVRAGMFGPYQAQKTLASEAVQGLVAAVVEREWATKVEEAGQSVPVMDLWVGRHEVLYSRIFNS